MKKIISIISLIFAVLMIASIPVGAYSSYQTYTYDIEGKPLSSPDAYTPLDQRIDSSIMGRIDEQVITALFGTQKTEKKGSLGLIETFSAATTIKAADLAVKTAKVEIFDLRVSRGMGGKGVVMLTGEIGDVAAAVEAGANYAAGTGQLSSQAVIAAPHADLWSQL